MDADIDKIEYQEFRRDLDDIKKSMSDMFREQIEFLKEMKGMLISSARTRSLVSDETLNAICKVDLQAQPTSNHKTELEVQHDCTPEKVSEFDLQSSLIGDDGSLIRDNGQDEKFRNNRKTRNGERDKKAFEIKGKKDSFPTCNVFDEIHQLNFLGTYGSNLIFQPVEVSKNDFKLVKKKDNLIEGYSNNEVLIIGKGHQNLLFLGSVSPFTSTSDIEEHVMKGSVLLNNGSSLHKEPKNILVPIQTFLIDQSSQFPFDPGNLDVPRTIFEVGRIENYDQNAETIARTKLLKSSIEDHPFSSDIKMGFEDFPIPYNEKKHYGLLDLEDKEKLRHFIGDVDVVVLDHLYVNGKSINRMSESYSCAGIISVVNATDNHQGVQSLEIFDGQFSDDSSALHVGDKIQISKGVHMIGMYISSSPIIGLKGSKSGSVSTAKGNYTSGNIVKLGYVSGILRNSLVHGYVWEALPNTLDLVYLEVVQQIHNVASTMLEFSPCPCGQCVMKRFNKHDAANGLLRARLTLNGRLKLLCGTLANNGLCHKDKKISMMCKFPFNAGGASLSFHISQLEHQIGSATTTADLLVLFKWFNCCFNLVLRLCWFVQTETSKFLSLRTRTFNGGGFVIYQFYIAISHRHSSYFTRVVSSTSC